MSFKRKFFLSHRQVPRIVLSLRNAKILVPVTAIAVIVGCIVLLAQSGNPSGFGIDLHQEAFPTNNTFYLSPSGDDTADGRSPATAWKTIQKINATSFHPGDHILLEGGQTFKSSVPLSLHANGPGDPANPIILDSFGNGRATLRVELGDAIQVYWIGGVEIRNLNLAGAGPQVNNGNGIAFQTAATAPFQGRVSHVSIHNVDISGFGNNGIFFWGEFENGFNEVSITDCQITDIGKNGIKFDGYSDIPHKVYPHSNLYIARNVVHDVVGVKGTDTGSGIIVSNANTATIELNTVYNNGKMGGASNGGPVGIWSYESTKITIQRNESFGNHSDTIDGGGFDLDGGSTQSIIQYNYSHDNDGPGFLMAQFPTADYYGNNIIRYNISENDGRKNNSGAIALWNGGSGIRDVDIYNNTVFISKNGNVENPALQFLTGSKNIKVWNNVFITSGGPLISVAEEQERLVFRGNAYWASGATFRVDWSGNTYESLTDWRYATGQEMIGPFETGFWGDPQYKNAGGGGTIGNATALWSLPGYRLKPTSPLIHRAYVTLWPGITSSKIDFFGNPVSTQSFDVGAVQYSQKNSNDTVLPLNIPTPVMSVPTPRPVTFKSGPIGSGLEAGLVAYYRMDELSWNGAGGEVKDSSGWENHGTVRNGAKTGPGKVGTAGGVFDGKSAVVNVNESHSLELTGPMTIATWVKFDYLPNRLTDLVIKSHRTTPWQSYELLYDNTSGQFGFTIANTSGEYPGSKGIDIVKQGVWYHVAGVYDGSTIITYVNGEAGVPTIYSGKPYSAIGSLFIGDEGDGDTDLPGTLDEIRIYNRALTATELMDLYHFVEPPK